MNKEMNINRNKNDEAMARSELFQKHLDFDTRHETALEAMVADCPEVSFPEHLHGRVMKRVFLAGYGKYLFASGAILTLNLGVLAVNLYSSITSIDSASAWQSLRQGFAMTPSYFSSAIGTLYEILPVQTIIAAALTMVLCVYIALIFVRGYRYPAKADTTA